MPPKVPDFIQGLKQITNKILKFEIFIFFTLKTLKRCTSVYHWKIHSLDIYPSQIWDFSNILKSLAYFTTEVVCLLGEIGQLEPEICSKTSDLLGKIWQSISRKLFDEELCLVGQKSYWDMVGMKIFRFCKLLYWALLNHLLPRPFSLNPPAQIS